MLSLCAFAPRAWISSYCIRTREFQAAGAPAHRFGKGPVEGRIRAFVVVASG